MSETIHQVDLSALDGANPLAFLAALGTLAVLSETDSHIRLGWHAGARWVPFITSVNPLGESEVLQRLTSRLRGKPVDSEKEKLRDTAQKRFDIAKKGHKTALDRFKKRGLRGKERDAARTTDIAPHERALNAARDELLAGLKEAVPSPNWHSVSGPIAPSKSFAGMPVPRGATRSWVCARRSTCSPHSARK